MTNPSNDRVLNFSAGPSTLPLSVLEEVQRDLINYKGTGVSVLEMSHRSKPYDAIIRDAEATLRRVLNVPSNYAVVFLQGGGTGEFAASYLNLFASKSVRAKQAKLGRALSCDYVVTGSWSKAGMKEVQRLGGHVNTVIDGVDGKYVGVLPVSQWKLGKPEETAFVYYCDNETVNGVECRPETVVDAVDPSVPVICDMSSNMMSRPIDIKRFGAIVAGAQKNMGPAGVTIAIVRDDLLERDDDPAVLHNLPSVLDWQYYNKGGSMPHTPPCFTIYVCGLVFKWVEKLGLDKVEQLREERAKIVYDVIDSHPEFFKGPVNKQYRSCMNLVFNLPTKELEAQFVAEAAQQNMIQLKGHRSVGGIRVSLYNAMTIEGAQAVAQFMQSFYDQHRQ